MTRKKIAVCISGGIKFHEKGLATIQKLSSIHNVKVFIHTWNIKDISSFDKNGWSGSFVNRGNVSKISDILEQYPVERIIVDDFETKKIKLDELLKHCSGNLIFTDRKDLGILSMFYSIWQSNKVKNDFTNENGDKFDCVIRMRFDSDLVNIENFDIDHLEDGKIYIPKGQDWNGINDQFAYGKNEAMNVYTNLILNVQNFRNIIYNPEVFLKFYLQNTGLKIVRPLIKVAINNGLTPECP